MSQQSLCSFDSYLNENRRSVALINSSIARNLYIQEHQKATNHSNVKVIPVVVHIIHNAGIENISDAQVQSQIDALNEDYRKLTGTPGDGAGVDTEIQFCLAKKDPQGRCTNGIVRIQSTLTNHQSFQRADLAALSSWDATRYLNIYVVKSISGGVLGYASFPGGPVNQDGCVLVHTAFGRIGTATTPNNMGRTTTHELGHWFALYHTFNGGCGNDTCLSGDLVCDTPPVINPNFGCPANANTCSNDVPNVNDQIQNYMDYTNDACKSMFTQGQKTRMQATLNTIRTTIWSLPNLISTGCDSGFISPPCNVVADFTSNGDTICLGSSVLFTNKSLNNPTSYKWYFAGGTPSVSSSDNATVTYNTLGSFPVKLVVTGSLGSDSVLLNNYITIINPISGQSLPFSEGFETGIFPPNNITIENPDAGITWQRDTIATPFAGSACVKINNLINTNYGQADALVLPPFDFTTYSGTPTLSFKWAYARSDANYSDEMVVLVSKDCGVNWAQVFYRTGNNMTTGPTQTTSYLPDQTTIWKTASISLATYSTSSRVLIKIVNVTDGGNNLYVDNINLGENTTGIDEQTGSIYNLLVYPNPASSTVFVNYKLLTSTNVNVTIVDMLGKTVYVNGSFQNPGEQQRRIDLAVENGLYNIIIKTSEVVFVKKIVFIK